MATMKPLKSCLLQHFLVYALFVSSVSYSFVRNAVGTAHHKRWTAQTASRATAFTHKSSVRSEISDVAKKMGMLKVERDIKRKEKLAADIAAEKADMSYRDYRSLHGHNEESSFIPGTYEYGFNTQSNDILLVNKNSGLGGSVPAGIVTLAITNFKREFGNIVETIKSEGDEDDQDEARNKLKLLKLDNDAIWAREKLRPEVKAPWVIKAPYFVLCYALDVLFDKQPMARFYTLETVARMPYFSYISMLQLYETLGWWRRSSEVKRIHFAEEYNEFNHLLIMEALGGDQLWRVRFFAQHAAVAYYFILILVWAISPTLAYNFSELIEAHAVDTYTEFAESNKDLLTSLQAPSVAKEYYENIDLYIFDEFQTDVSKGSRRPEVNSLYDVFLNIRDDEGAHVSTMNACQNPDKNVISSNTEEAMKMKGLL